MDKICKCRDCTGDDKPLAALIKLFKTHLIRRASSDSGSVAYEIYDTPEKFTWAQLHQLPAILGTEHIDFEPFSDCTFGGSEVTPAEYDSGMRIIARPAK